MATVGHCGLYLETNSAVLPEVVIVMIAAAPMWYAACTALTALQKKTDYKKYKIGYKII
jgi:hypothetical protein